VSSTFLGGLERLWLIDMFLGTLRVRGFSWRSCRVDFVSYYYLCFFGYRNREFICLLFTHLSCFAQVVDHLSVVVGGSYML
jgi:hypothetical protein